MRIISKKCFKQKLFRSNFSTKTSVDFYFYFSREWSKETPKIRTKLDGIVTLKQTRHRDETRYRNCQHFFFKFRGGFFFYSFRSFEGISFFTTYLRSASMIATYVHTRRYFETRCMNYPSDFWVYSSKYIME